MESWVWWHSDVSLIRFILPGLIKFWSTTTYLTVTIKSVIDYIFIGLPVVFYGPCLESRCWDVSDVRFSNTSSFSCSVILSFAFVLWHQQQDVDILFKYWSVKKMHCFPAVSNEYIYYWFIGQRESVCRRKTKYYIHMWDTQPHWYLMFIQNQTIYLLVFIILKCHKFTLINQKQSLFN